MNFKEYQDAAQKVGYRERLDYIVGTEATLKSFLPFASVDVEVKIHIAKTIICRHFGAGGDVALPADIKWFIRSFLKEFDQDKIKPWISGAIKESIRMIASEDTFVKKIIGMTFMFGVVEFYAKYRLGWRPESLNHFDEAHKNYREMSIAQAINKLKRQPLKIAGDLNEIDKECIGRLKEIGMIERGFIKARIADRLQQARNVIVHGETHSFYNMADYLVMLYALFHYHSMEDGLNMKAYNFIIM